MILTPPSDIAFKIFNFPVYWYGIIMAISIFIGFLCANHLYNKLNPDEKDFIIENAPVIIVFGMLSARFYFCCLNFKHYIANPIEILNFRQGGLSIHGALIGAILTITVICLKNKIKILKILDCCSIATILGQSIGRFGNFFNSEAYGFPVLNQSWGLYIEPAKRIFEFQNYSLFHPAFLYESFFDLLGFFILLFIFYRNKHKIDGVIFFLYLIIYAIIRFFIERIRIDSALNIGNIHIAQIASVLIFLIGIFGLCFLRYKYCENKKNEL